MKRSIKEKITPKNSVGKLENTIKNNCTESDAERRFKSSELIDRDLYWVKDGEEDRISRMGTGSWRKQTEGGRRLVNNVIETLLSQAGASASSMGDVTRRMVTGDKETAVHHHGHKYYEGTWLTSVSKLMSRMQT